MTSSGNYWPIALASNSENLGLREFQIYRTSGGSQITHGLAGNTVDIRIVTHESVIPLPTSSFKRDVWAKSAWFVEEVSMLYPLFPSFRIGLLIFFASLDKATAIPSTTEPGPVVKLNYGSFRGNVTGNVESFLGMPFAAPPYAYTQVGGQWLWLNALAESEIFDLRHPNLPWPLTVFVKLHHMEQLAFNKRPTRLSSVTSSQLSRLWLPVEFLIHLLYLRTVCRLQCTVSSLLFISFSGLFINVVKPAYLPVGKKVPVLFVSSDVAGSTIFSYQYFHWLSVDLWRCVLRPETLHWEKP